MPTLGGHPGRRVHPAGTLEGEFDVRHADPGRHVFIYLRAQATVLTAVRLCVERPAGGSDSHHHALAVEIVTRDHWFKRVQEGHSTGNVQGKLHGLGLVHHKV